MASLKSENGNLFINDQQVLMVGAGGATYRNKIINGRFDVWQRSNSPEHATYKFMLGSNQGNLIPNVTANTAIDNGDYYSFNGAESVDTIDTDNVTYSEVYVRFRLAAGSLGTGAQVIWKSGGGTNGVAIGINASDVFGFFGRSSSTLTEALLTGVTLQEGRWYSAMGVTGGVVLFDELTGEIFYDISSVTVGEGTGVEGIGSGNTSSPITGVAGDYFKGDISNVYVYNASNLAMTSSAGPRYFADRFLLEYGFVSIGAPFLMLPNFDQGIKATLSYATDQTAYPKFEQRIEDPNEYIGNTLVCSIVGAFPSGVSMNVVAGVTDNDVGNINTLDVGTIVGDGTVQTYTFTYVVPSATTGYFNNTDYMSLTIENRNTASYYIDLREIQLEEGSVATPFELRPKALEEILCKKYYQRYDSVVSDQKTLSLGTTSSTGNALAPFRYDIEMRVAPSVATSSSSTFNALLGSGTSYVPSLIGLADIHNDSLLFLVTIGTATSNLAVVFRFETGTSGYIALDAEI